MVGILVRAPAPALRRVVQVGAQVVRAEKAGGAAETGGVETEVLEGNRLAREKPPAVRCIEALEVSRAVEVPGGAGTESQALEGEMARRLARRELLVGRLAAARTAACEARLGAAGAQGRAGVVERREGQFGDAGGGTPSEVPAGATAEVREGSLKRLAEPKPVRARATSATTAGGLAVKAGAHRGGEWGAERDGWRGARRGEFEAEEDLRLELVR